MGHALDMIGRDKNNQALRKTYRERFNKLKEKHLEKVKMYSGNINVKDVSEEDLEKIKLQVRASIIRERRATIEKTVLITVIVLVLLVWVVSKIL